MITKIWIIFKLILLATKACYKLSRSPALSK
jgi:hypothetical protein